MERTAARVIDAHKGIIMKKAVRYFLFVVCAVQFFFALAFFLQWPLATGHMALSWYHPAHLHLHFLYFRRGCRFNPVGNRF